MPVEIKNLNGEVIYVFPGDTLVGANLSGKNLTRADLRDRDLTQIDLENAHCRGADFSRSVMKNAWMVYIRATSATFRETDLEGANIERGNLEEADLLEAKNWNKLKNDFQLKLAGARLPDGQIVPKGS